MLGRQKIALCLLLVICSAGALAKVEITKARGKKVYDFTIDDVSFRKVSLNNTEYLKPKFNGVDNYNSVLYRKGYPEVPAVTFTVFADNAKDVKVNINDQLRSKTSLTLNGLIAPSQESIAKIKGAKVPFLKNTGLYSSNSFYPFYQYEVRDAGSIRGRKMQQVSVYPMSYNAKMNSYKITSNFQVEVTENQPLRDAGQETFVFIVGQKYIEMESFLRYSKLKKDLGYLVKTIVVTDQTPEMIRAELKGIYADERYNVKHALIIGDIDDVPAPRAKTLSKSTFVTDHYYRAIDTDDYDSDLNGPDIGVGRITVNNEQELNNVISKFEMYQLGTFENTEWFNHTSFIATDDRYVVAEGSHNYALSNFFENSGYTGDFPNDPQLGGDKLYAITHKVSDSRVVENINKGRFLVNYSGHGATTYWAGPHVRQNDVRGLSSTALPFVVSNACITGQFILGESFAETWIKQPKAAIAFWGSMDSSYWDEDDILEKAMYHGIFDDNLRDFASITDNALTAVWNHYAGKNRSKYYWETYVVFGDPSIDFRVKAPLELNVEGANVLPYGVESTTYVISDSSGKPVEGVRVAISHVEGEYTNARYTDANGVVVLPLSGANVAENYKVVVYGDDYKTYSGNIFMASPDYPFFLLKKIISNNGTLDVVPHEEIELSLNVVNVSPIASTGGKLEIESIEGLAEVVNGEVHIPALSGNESAVVSGIKIKVGNYPTEGSLKVALKWTSNEGESSVRTVPLNVHRGVLAIDSVDFGDPSSPTDGGMSVGDSGAVYVTYVNTGSRKLSNVNVVVNPVGSKFEIDGSHFIETLLPGEKVRIDSGLQVQLSDGVVVDEALTFSLKGNHQGLYGKQDVESSSSFIVGKYSSSTAEFDNIALAIEDKKTVEFPFVINANIDSIKEVSFSVKITHTYVGDLTLTLVHPSGKAVQLRKKQGGSQDNLDETYGVETEALGELSGLTTDGEWKLQVNDSSSNDVGTLDYISIYLKGFI